MGKFKELLDALPEYCNIVITKFENGEGLDIYMTDPEEDRECAASLIKQAGYKPIQLTDISEPDVVNSTGSSLKAARKEAMKRWGK